MPLSLSAISNRASHGLCKAALSSVFIICKGAWLIMMGKGHVDAGGMQEHWRLKLHGNDPLVFHGLAVLGNWDPTRHMGHHGRKGNAQQFSHEPKCHTEFHGYAGFALKGLVRKKILETA